jgi:catechol 2,3-dioxygenase-like lactoylglutathione lyase family enzyme
MKRLVGLTVLMVCGLFLLTVSIHSSPAAPVEVAEPTVDPAIYRRIAQIGWVVKDVDSVVDYWEALGLKNIHRGTVREFQDITYRGKKGPLSFKFAGGQFGDVEIEWVQPVKGKSVFDEFLARHGDGIHHLAFAMPSPEKLKEQIEYFKSKGITPVESGSWQGTKGTGHFAYLDMGPEGGGLTFELFCNPDLAPPGSQSHNDYPLNQIAHYAVIVRDVKQVTAFYERLGFGGIALHPLDLTKTENMKVEYLGQPTKLILEVGWWRWGTRPIEWLQSVAGPSVYDDYFKNHGDGVQHLGFDVTDMDAALDLLKQRGVRPVQTGAWDSPSGPGRFAYLDTDAHGGVTVELVWEKPRTQ